MKKLVCLWLILPLIILWSTPGIAFIKKRWTPQDGGSGIWDLDSQIPENFFQDGKVKYRLITSGPFAIPSEDFIWAIVNAFQTWEDVVDSAIAFSRGSDVTSDPWDSDFSIGFSDAAGNTQYGNNIAGIVGQYVSTRSGTTQKLINADICLNANFSWSTDGSTIFDVENTALHEIGHSIGIAHTPHILSRMSYLLAWNGISLSRQGNRRLTVDDEIITALLYPEDGFSSQTGNLAGTIFKGATPVHQAQIGVFDGTGNLIATTLSKEGQYLVEGLRPGAYTLRAFPTFPYSEQTGLYMRSGELPWDDVSPTNFLATHSHDKTAMVVAESTTTANMLVASGTPQMRCLRTIRYSSSWNGLSAGIRLKRGDTARIGLTGLNLPRSADELAELSISGGE